jgi:hypothetical protein
MGELFKIINFDLFGWHQPELHFCIGHPIIVLHPIAEFRRRISTTVPIAK